VRAKPPPKIMEFESQQKRYAPDEATGSAPKKQMAKAIEEVFAPPPIVAKNGAGPTPAKAKAKARAKAKPSRAPKEEEVVTPPGNPPDVPPAAGKTKRVKVIRIMKKSKPSTAPMPPPEEEATGAYTRKAKAKPSRAKAPPPEIVVMKRDTATAKKARGKYSAGEYAAEEETTKTKTKSKTIADADSTITKKAQPDPSNLSLTNVVKLLIIEKKEGRLSPAQIEQFQQLVEDIKAKGPVAVRAKMVSELRDIYRTGRLQRA
jgi:hypothetical protein